jgi:hypothetical protein
MVRPNNSLGTRRHNHEAGTYTPQEEDTASRSHLRRDGYRPGLSPGVLNRILAKGQSSTDLNNYRDANISDFGSSVTPGGDPAVDHSPGWNRETTIQPWESDLTRGK